LIYLPDLSPGLAIRLTSRLATKVAVSFPEVTRYFPGKAVVTGYPVRSELLAADRAAAHQALGLQPDLPTLLVFGGSQGARSINQAIQEFLRKREIPANYQILWQTGKQDYDTIYGFVRKEKQEGIRVTPFIEDMFEAYAITDFAVCRAGAMTLSELAAAGVPAILVPYPYAAADHQVKNAQALEERGAAFMVKENLQLTENTGRLILKLCSDEAQKEVMRNHLLSMEADKGLDRIMAELDLLMEGIRN
jgi:UDP-N-acetylglucosamine--N-acetylmuramyl-(pentapeptide) pyrophosphoryl-undecaprenol N-acetylglucosamine transferase